MSYTTSKQPQGFPFCFTNLLREAMIAEIVAINGYAEHIANSNIKELNDLWHHIMQEEKKHFGMFLELLRKYDPTEYQRYKQVKSELDLTNKCPKFPEYHPKYNDQLILNNVRDDIKGELEAIVLYEDEVLHIKHKDIIDTFMKVISEEKEHTEELTLFLTKYDKDKYNNIS